MGRRSGTPMPNGVSLIEGEEIVHPSLSLSLSLSLPVSLPLSPSLSLSLSLSPLNRSLHDSSPLRVWASGSQDQRGWSGGLESDAGLTTSCGKTAHSAPRAVETQRD